MLVVLPEKVSKCNIVRIGKWFAAWGILNCNSVVVNYRTGSVQSDNRKLQKVTSVFNKPSTRQTVVVNSRKWGEVGLCLVIYMQKDCCEMSFRNLHREKNPSLAQTTCLPVFIPSGSGDATTVKYGALFTFALEVGFFLQFSQWNPDQLCSMVIQLNSWSLPQFWHLRLVPRPNIYPSGEQDISVEGQDFELDLSWKCFYCVEVYKSLSNIPVETFCINIGLLWRVKILFYFGDRIQISWHFFQPWSLNSHGRDCRGTQALSAAILPLFWMRARYTAPLLSPSKKMQISCKVWILKRAHFLNSLNRKLTDPRLCCGTKVKQEEIPTNASLWAHMSTETRYLWCRSC